MNKIFLLIIFLFSLNKIAIAKDNEFSPDNLFHIDHMNSHNKDFALYFKGRENSILARGENENYKKIKNINSPILVMHGEVDQIVPFSMGKKIYEIANEPKYSYFTEYDNHMMEYDEKLVLALKSFLKSLN